MSFSFRFQKARKLDEDAELPCFLALCVDLFMLALFLFFQTAFWPMFFGSFLFQEYHSSSDAVSHCIVCDTLDGQIHIWFVYPRIAAFKFYNIVSIHSPAFIQREHESTVGILSSVIGLEHLSALSYFDLGAPAVQRVLWIFFLSLVLPWFFLFFHWFLPRNGQRNMQQEQHAQQQQDELFAARMQQVQQEMGNRDPPPVNVHEREDDE
jgi:hypothetical protein